MQNNDKSDKVENENEWTRTPSTKQTQKINDILGRDFKHTEPDVRTLTKINITDRMKALLRGKMDFNLMDDELLEFWESVHFDE